MMKLQQVTIKTDSIALDQLLKWANIVSSGGEAKQLIKSGMVKLNDQMETRRGKKVFRGDKVIINEEITLLVQ